MARTYYQRLKIPPDATQEMIIAAFRRLALRFHPDKVVHLDEETQRSALRKMQGISEAFTALRNPELRKLYDHCLSEKLDFSVESVHFKTSEKVPTETSKHTKEHIDDLHLKLEKVVRAIVNIPNFARGDKRVSDGCFDAILRGRYRRDRCLIHIKCVKTLTLDALEEIISSADMTKDENNAVLSRACHSFVIVADEVESSPKVNYFIDTFNKRSSLAPRGEPLRLIVLMRKGDAVPFIPHGATVSPPFILLRMA